MSKPVIETTLEQMKNSYDWANVFASAGVEDGAFNTTGAPVAIPGYAGSVAPFGFDDVADVIASVEGENEGASWVCVVRLRDGRFAVLDGSCDYTGWDCQAGASCSVGATLADVIRFGVCEPDCRRLGLALADDVPSAGHVGDVTTLYGDARGGSDATATTALVQTIPGTRVATSS